MTVDTRINIRITPELLAKLQQWCKDNGTTPSDEIRRYIVKLTKPSK